MTKVERKRNKIDIGEKKQIHEKTQKQQIITKEKNIIKR